MSQSGIKLKTKSTTGDKKTKLCSPINKVENRRSEKIKNPKEFRGPCGLVYVKGTTVQRRMINLKEERTRTRISGHGCFRYVKRKI